MKSSYLLNLCSIKWLLSLQTFLQNSCHSGFLCIFTALYVYISWCYVKNHIPLHCQKEDQISKCRQWTLSHSSLFWWPDHFYACLYLSSLGCFYCCWSYPFRKEDAVGIREASLHVPHLAIILYHHCRSYKQQSSLQSSPTTFPILLEHLLHKYQY